MKTFVISKKKDRYKLALLLKPNSTARVQVSVIWDELVSHTDRPCSAAQNRVLASLCEGPVPPPALKTRQS